jgi:hypothetical protein
MRDLTGEHDCLDVVAARGLRVLVLEPGDDCTRGGSPGGAINIRATN